MSIEVQNISVAVISKDIATGVSRDVHGFWRFKKCLVRPFYDAVISSHNLPNNKFPWEFVVGFLVNTEHVTGTLNPIIQVWEHYNPAYHSESDKYNLIAVNGVVFKDMCKLTSRRLPDWISEMNGRIADYVKLNLLLNHSDFFTTSTEKKDWHKIKSIKFNGIRFRYGDNRDDLRNIELIQTKIAKAVFEGVFKKIKTNWQEWELPYGGDFFKEDNSQSEDFADDNAITEAGQSVFRREVLFKAATEIAKQVYPETESLTYLLPGSKNYGDLGVSPLEFKLKLRV